MKKYNIILAIICFVLFTIPFFWMKPGQVDLGGDASRLYFYDPVNYLRNVVLYSIFPIGQGIEYSYIFTLPFVIILVLLKAIFNSPYLLITIFNSFTLSFSFLSIYLIIRELLNFNKNIKRNETYINFAGIIAGLFYVFIPISFGGGWDKALLDFPLLFLNPFVFWLILRFLHTSKKLYLLLLVIISFIFSTNYSYASSPKFLSFYPFIILFFIFYSWLIIKKKISLKVIFLFAVLFLLVQMFHLLPTAMGLFKENTFANTKVFSATERQADIKYFLSLAATIKVAPILLGGPSSFFFLHIYTLVFPILIIFGAILNRQKERWRNNSKIYLLLLSFFLLTFFLTSVNITNIGKSFYTSLFYVFPGFTMFRSFVGQWIHSFLFFYSLLVGFSIFYILSVLKNKIKYLLYVFVFLLLTAGAKNFITGDASNRILVESKGVKVKSFFTVDASFDKSVSYLRHISTDSKNLSFPLTGHFYQVLGGTNGGAYIGPSIIAYLSGKHDFGSSVGLGSFTEPILELGKAKNYKSFSNIFPLFSIQSVFYNSDFYILDNFPQFPYEQMRGYMPKDQDSYKLFINNLPLKKEKDFGDKYHIYRVSESFLLPHIYLAKKYIGLNPKTYTPEYILNNFLTDSDLELRKVFFENNQLKPEIAAPKRVPKLVFTKINQTKYKITVSNAKDPYLLVFSESFNKDWKLFVSDSVSEDRQISASYFDGEILEGKHQNIFFDKNTFETWGKKSIANNNHFFANFYANAWYIEPKDTGNKSQYVLILEMTSQRVFYIGLFISFITFSICLSWLCVILFQSAKKIVNKKE